LVFFGGIGAFQWVTTEKIKKSDPAQLASKVVRKRLKSNSPVLFLSLRGWLQECEGSDSASEKDIAQVLFSVKPLCAEAQSDPG
jgi:hypothetical protein